MVFMNSEPAGGVTGGSAKHAPLSPCGNGLMCTVPLALLCTTCDVSQGMPTALRRVELHGGEWYLLGGRATRTALCAFPTSPPQAP